MINIPYVIIMALAFMWIGGAVETKGASITDLISWTISLGLITWASLWGGIL